MAPENREHIFIVEDNRIYSMVLDYILTKDSVYKFSSFQTGEECVRCLDQDPDIVILDYALPGMNGYDTLLEIKKYDPNIHVLMLSNIKDERLASKLVAAGADDYILKQGHGEQQVVEKIEALLTRKKIKDSINAEAARKTLVKKILYAGLGVSLLLLGIVAYGFQEK